MKEEQYENSLIWAWITEDIKRATENWTIPNPYSQEDLQMIMEWIKATDPDLEYLTLATAYDPALAYKKQQSTRKYTGQIIYRYKDGFTVSSVPDKDIPIERLLMENGEGELLPIYGIEDTRFVEDGNWDSKDSKTYIYSLRDLNGFPVATIEILATETPPVTRLYIRDVFAKSVGDVSPSDEKTHPFKDKIAEFFNFLRSKGYVFDTSPQGIEEVISSSKIEIGELKDTPRVDQFGLRYNLSSIGIGGSAEQYHENLSDAYSAGWAGTYWYESTSKHIVDDLISWASTAGELDLMQQALEGYETTITNKKGERVKAYKSFNDESWEMWIQSEDSWPFENQDPGEDGPDKEDFMIPPDPKQPAIPGLPKPVPVLDKEAYKEAVAEWKAAKEAFEKERDQREEYFEPYRFQNYVYKAIENAQKNKATNTKTKGKSPSIKELSKLRANMQTTIYKIADKKVDDNLPSGEALGLYVQTLKMCLKDNPKMDEKLADLINNLPSARKVRQDFSFQESKLLYETLEYLWKKITNTNIVPEKDITLPPETLFGSYWMLKNGLLLSGINHYGIVKSNPILFSKLLNIGGMTLQEHLASPPNKLIALIIKSGGVRIFITKDKRLYSQMSSDTYGLWGKEKIQKLDFKKKVIKIIDFKTEYKGWTSGIPIIL